MTGWDIEESTEEHRYRGDAGDMWHALACFQGAHPEPVAPKPTPQFEHPLAVLSIVEPGEMAFSARVDLTEITTTAHLHDLIRTLTRDAELDPWCPTYGYELEIFVGRRHDLPLHHAHINGLTRILRQAARNLRSPQGGRCGYCDGTGLVDRTWTGIPG